jgi:hypothetical protein
MLRHITIYYAMLCYVTVYYIECIYVSSVFLLSSCWLLLCKCVSVELCPSRWGHKALIVPKRACHAVTEWLHNRRLAIFYPDFSLATERSLGRRSRSQNAFGCWLDHISECSLRLVTSPLCVDITGSDFIKIYWGLTQSIQLASIKGCNYLTAFIAVLTECAFVKAHIGNR